MIFSRYVLLCSSFADPFKLFIAQDGDWPRDLHEYLTQTLPKVDVDENKRTLANLTFPYQSLIRRI